MSGIHDVNKDEDVNGEVVGIVCLIGAVFYEGRKQSQNFYAEDEAILTARAEKFIDAKRIEFGDLFLTIWPHAKWELRIF